MPASIQLGKKTVAFPKMNASWRKVTATYTTGAQETSMTLSVRVNKALRGLSVDNLVLVPAVGDKKNVVPNASFESVRVARGIANSSLVMTTPTATVAAALPKGAASWEVFRGSKRVAGGKVSVKSALVGIPLNGVSQGLFTLKLRGSDKRTVQTSIAIVDSPTPWVAMDGRYGVGLHVESPTYAQSGRYSRALGLAHARNDLLWAFNEPKKGKYNFSVYDGPLARLDANGLKVLGIVNYGNRAYGSKNEHAPTTKDGIAAYGRYAAQLAKRYNLSGLEVYNEFNWPAHNKSGCLTAKCYLPLLKSVDSAVKKVKPSLPIVAGATAKYQGDWFDKLWGAQGLKSADAMSFHPYETTGAPEKVSGLVRSARAGMKKHGKAKPVWLTELGTSSAKGNRTQAQQASILVRSSVTAFANGASRFYWYDLINDGPSAKEHYHNFGLYAHPKGGVAALGVKQSGFSQALTITQLGGRAFRTSENLGSGVVSQAFGRAGDSVRVVWAPKGKKTATIKTKSSVVVVRSDGTKRTIKPTRGLVKFAVDSNPTFVRSGNATAGVTK